MTILIYEDACRSTAQIREDLPGATLGNTARKATVFEFDTHLVTVPLLEASEVAVRNGLFHLPAPICWIEFDGFADHTGKINETLKGGELPHIALLMWETRDIEDLICILPFHWHPQVTLNAMPGACGLGLESGKVFQGEFPIGYDWGKGGADAKIISSAIDNHIRALCCFVMALQCKDVDVHEIGASPRIRRKREARGLPPLVEYKKLVIKQHLKAIYEGEARALASGERQAPRFHFVRGHVREYKPGAKTMVVPHYRGHAELGVIHKTYEVKEPD